MNTEFIVRHTPRNRLSIIAAAGVCIGLGSAVMIVENGFYFVLGAFLLLVGVLCGFLILWQAGFKLEVKGQHISYKKNVFKSPKNFTLDEITNIRSETAFQQGGKNTQNTHIAVSDYNFHISSDMKNYEKFVELITNNTEVETIHGSGRDETTDGQIILKPHKALIITYCVIAGVVVFFSLPLVIITILDFQTVGVVDNIFNMLRCVPFAIAMCALFYNIRQAGYRVEVTDHELIFKAATFSAIQHTALCDIESIVIDEPAKENKFTRSASILVADRYLVLAANLRGFENFVEHMQKIMPERFRSYDNINPE